MLKDILEERGLSVYKVSKETGVPYSTLNDIVIEKTDFQKVSANTLYRLSRYLELTMNELYEEAVCKKVVFYLYNEGRNIVLEYEKKKIQYLGPKNLLSFHRINKIDGNVIYVDCYFESSEGTVYREEDYIDLEDVLDEDREVLENFYIIEIGKPTSSSKEMYKKME